MKALLITGLALALCACSGVFPDRKNEYKDSQEIPALELPPDLSTSSIEDPTIISAEATETSSATLSDYVQRQQNPEVATLAQSAQEYYLDINQDFPRAWNMVGKALTRLGLEIADRDRSKGTYYIVYSDAPKKESESLFSYLAFWRTDKSKESEYHIKLTSSDNVTRVALTNREGKPESQETSLRLMKMLRDELQKKP